MGAYRETVRVEHETAGRTCAAHLEFAWFAVVREFTKFYDEVVEAMGAMEETYLVFPINKYRYFGALALICVFLGDGVYALRMAQNALRAAMEREEPFPRHCTVSVVKKVDERTRLRIEEIAGVVSATDSVGSPLTHLNASNPVSIIPAFTPTPVTVTRVVVGMNAEQPRFEFVDDNGKIQDFDIDLMKAIGEAAGVEPECVNTRWDGIFVALASGEFDAGISATAITDERKQLVDFSDPYINTGLVLAVKKGSDILKMLTIRRR